MQRTYYKIRDLLGDDDEVWEDSDRERLLRHVASAIDLVAVDDCKLRLYRVVETEVALLRPRVRVELDVVAGDGELCDDGALGARVADDVPAPRACCSVVDDAGFADCHDPVQVAESGVDDDCDDASFTCWRCGQERTEPASDDDEAPCSICVAEMEPLAQDEGKDCTDGGAGNEDCDDGCACTVNGDECGSAGIDAADDDTCRRCGLDRLLDDDGLCRSCAADAESDEPDDDDGDGDGDGDYDGDYDGDDGDDGDDGEDQEVGSQWAEMLRSASDVHGKVFGSQGCAHGSVAIVELPATGADRRRQVAVRVGYAGGVRQTEALDGHSANVQRQALVSAGSISASAMADAAELRCPNVLVLPVAAAPAPDDGDCGACDADDGSLAVCDDGEHCKPVTLEVWRHLTPAQRVIVGKAIHNDGMVEASDLSRPTKSLAALDKLGVAVGVYDDLSQLQRVVIAPGPWDDDLIEQARKDCPDAFDIEPKGTLDAPQPAAGSLDDPQLAAGSLDDPQPDGGAATGDVPADVSKWRAKIRAELAGVVQPWVEKRRGSPHIERLAQPFLRIAGQLRPSRAVFEAHSLSWESEYDAAGRDVAAAAGCEYDASRADFVLPPQAPAPAAQDQAADETPGAADSVVVTSYLDGNRLHVTVDDGAAQRPYVVSWVDSVAWRGSGASSLAHATKSGRAAVERWLQDRSAVYVGHAADDGVVLDERRVVVTLSGEVWGRDDYRANASAEGNATRLRQALRSEHREREVRALLHSFGFRMWSAPVRGAS